MEDKSKDLDQEYREYVIREINEAMKCTTFYTHEEIKELIRKRQEERLKANK